jgi:hypothetical protein
MSDAPTIWRAAVMPLEDFHVEMPSGSELLGLSRNGSGPQLYFRVHKPDALKASWRFFVAPTGGPLSPDAERAAYVGTFQTEGRLGEALVFHVFFDGPCEWRNGWRK